MLRVDSFPITLGRSNINPHTNHQLENHCQNINYSTWWWTRNRSHRCSQSIRSWGNRQNLHTSCDLGTTGGTFTIFLRYNIIHFGRCLAVMDAFPGHNHQSVSLCSIPCPWNTRGEKNPIHFTNCTVIHVLRLAGNAFMIEIFLDILHQFGYIRTIPEKDFPFDSA